MLSPQLGHTLLWAASHHCLVQRGHRAGAGRQMYQRAARSPLPQTHRREAVRGAFAALLLFVALGREAENTHSGVRQSHGRRLVSNGGRMWSWRAVKRSMVLPTFACPPAK